MAIPRRLIFIAAGAVATAGYIMVRNKLDADRRESAEREREFRRGPRPVPDPAPGTQESTKKSEASDDRSDMSGGERELSEFLAGDSWFDESGWKSIWNREGIDDQSAWLKSQGLETLRREREKLSDHPALLAGCRRRWIVVARYAEIDVSEAAELWSSLG